MPPTPLLFAALCAVAAASSPGLRSTSVSPLSTLTANPFPASAPGVWTWVPITGSKCIDGTETGVWIKKGPAAANTTKLGIYHDGGGACFNFFTCLTCSTNAHPGAPGNGGIFDSTDARNPYKDFSWIWVPYCTGDVHVGQVEKRFEGKMRHFVGRNNLDLMMARATASFPTVNTLVVSGESAGGFGAVTNYDFYRSFYPGEGTRGVLVDDSGPVLDDTALAPCLQAGWRSTWNLNASLPAQCPCVGDAGNLVTIWKFNREKWPKDSFGLISSVTDMTISTFFSFGMDNCKKVVPLGYTALQGGLTRLAATGVPVYMISGGTHVHTGSHGEFYTRKVGETFLYEWVTALVADGVDPGTITPPATTITPPATATNAAVGAAASAAAAGEEMDDRTAVDFDVDVDVDVGGKRGSFERLMAAVEAGTDMGWSGVATKATVA